MVGIKDFGMPSCCMNCEMFDAEEYGICVIIGDTQDFEYQWNENRPFDCPLVEVIPKDEYEARLNADMVAMLEELYMEIEELDNPLDYDFEGYDTCVVDCEKLIQQKIDKLEEQTDGANTD